jgi:energy-coupling factor transporter ATP-binding protein EcfA2
MENVVEVRDVSYRYPRRKEPAIENLSFSIREGEFILIAGSSGSGKSTLCRMLNGLVPKYSGGWFSGRVVVGGIDTRDAEIAELSKHVGFVFQDPENQFVMTSVENELAFGLENMRLDSGEIRERVVDIAVELNIRHLLERKTAELSGGEKQKVVLASILALKPSILVLDEPTSQLDPQARREFLQTIAGLNDEGMTIVLVEHNTGEVLDSVDRVLDLDKRGFIPPSELEAGVEYRRHYPVKAVSGRECIIVGNLSKWYAGRQVLFDINLVVHEGEFIALTGSNGSGKTTLVKHFNGLFRPEEGVVSVDGMDVSKARREDLSRIVGYVPQNPSDSFFHETVEGEVAQTLRNFNINGGAVKVLEKFNLHEQREAYPRDLSVGQRQRLALASATAYNPKILVLDEPTRGIDSKSRHTLVKLLHKIHDEGTTIIMITQDEKLAGTADRRIVLEKGRIQDGDGKH